MKAFPALLSVFLCSSIVFALPLRSQSRSICEKDDMTSILTESEQIKEMSTPIGIWQIDENGMGGMCTGTLISKDLFLTAEHCFAECKSISVTFGYWKDGRLREETFGCKEIVEKGNGEQQNDYLIVRLEGNPGVNLGWYDVSARKMKKGDALMMIHHPGGSPMKVSLKNCATFNQSNEFLEHRCDTMPGSSGAGILVPDFNKVENTRIVAVHTLGGCKDDATSYNSGPSIRHLVEVSPLLKEMAKP